MSMMGFSAALGGAEGVEEVLESSPAYTAAASRKIKERAGNRRINTSKKCSECIAGRTASVSDWKFSDGVRDAMMMLIIEGRAPKSGPRHSSVAQWQSIRLLTEGLSVRALP